MPFLFQSYLSPIQTSTSARMEHGARRFQSYLSPIQTLSRWSTWTQVINFNPTLVQFKPDRSREVLPWSQTFQSYLSPIQTGNLIATLGLDKRFQSYLSPIQTTLGSRTTATFTTDFNPTLVQFKQGGPVMIMTCTDNFNPTLVQFKPGCCGGCMISDVIFQSYLSPIQTGWRRPPDGKSHPHFNPTLVQFKRGIKYDIWSFWCDFNPTLVQFKPEDPPLTDSSFLDFNPTLVQFKPFMFPGWGLTLLEFQSYLSPIQTPKSVICSNR